MGAIFKNKFSWSLKDIVLMVVLGVVFGFLYWVLVQGWLVLAIVSGPLGDLMENVMLGGWLLVAPIAIAIIRKPFSGIIAEMLASAVEVVFLGSPFGPVLFVTAFLQGLGSEIPFAVGRYKNFVWQYYVFSGAMGALIAFFYSAFRSAWFGTDLFFIRLVLQTGSGILLGGLLAKVIVDALYKTGVLDNYAIGKVNETS